MKIKNKVLILLLLFIGIIFALNNPSYAGTQHLNSLDFDVQLNEDGSMKVVETWDIYVSGTNTLFKDFEMDNSKYSEITDVIVSCEGSDLTQIDEEMYHVTSGCYYALPISGGKFEIAWNVGLDNSSATREYEISYVVKDAVTVYNDCNELYWMFLNNENGIPADKVTGTIKLPKSVSDSEKLRIWAHGPLNGEIYKISNDTVKFEIDNLPSQTMLEARVVVEEPIFDLSTKIKFQNKLNNILEEEQQWADEANRLRNRSKNLFTCAVAGVLTVNILIGFIYFKKILKYKNQLKEVKEENPEYEINIGKYFRDIPREKDATPAEAGFLYYSSKNRFYMGNAMDKVFSATLLQLCLKKYISFEVIDKKNIKINLLKDSEDSDLKPSEKCVYYDILEKVAGLEKNSITMEDIKKFAKSHYDEFNNIINSMESNAKDSHESLKNYDLEKKRIVDSCNSKIMAYIFSTFLLLGLSFIILPVLIEWIICAILLHKISNHYLLLTEQGELERQQWKGLKKYMEDFSMLDQREIPDLVLWEKYLVYATTFGIADKVIKQLKIVYPQIQNLDSKTYTYLYLMSDNSISNDFVNDFNKMTSNTYNAYRYAYNAAHSSSSSGSGGGGGFSGGGGGRRWRRKHGRKIRVLKKGEYV